MEWHAVVARRAFCFCWMNPLVGFGGSMARNCSETQIFYGNCRKHRAKRSFWKLCSRKFEGSLAEGSRTKSQICISPQFWTSDEHETTRGLPDDPGRFAFHLSFGRPMSTKRREGCPTTQADSHFTSVLDVR